MRIHTKNMNLKQIYLKNEYKWKYIIFNLKCMVRDNL